MNGYIFKLNKTTSTKKYYRCEDPRCNVTVHTDINDNYLKSNGDHDHPPEPEKIEIRTFKHIVKQRAIHETTAIPGIYDEETAKMCLTFSSIAILPSEREMSSSLNKARRLETPVIPDSQTFDIPDLYTRTLKNEPFICIDKMIKRKTRLLVFASKEQLKLLFQSPIILMDGTFAATPAIFDQVYGLHVIKYEQSFVCAFGLLPDRKKCTYKFLFNELKDLALSINMVFNPTTIMSDFEPSLAETISSEFPNASHVGCFFHFTQAVYRNIQRVGLSGAYGDNENVRIICRKLMALALMPLSLVLHAFEDLYDDVIQGRSETNESLKLLFEYFENQWIKTVDIKRWNVYGLQIRTNNNAEGYHNRLNLRLSKCHPNIWAFIKCLQGEENKFNHMMIQMKAGLAARKKAATTIAIQQRIDTLYLRYERGDIQANELLNGLTCVVAKNVASKKK